MSPQLQATDLPLWTEIVGVFCRVLSDDSYLYVKIENKLLCFAKESVESNIVQEKLRHDLIGRKIGLLRTDEPMKPLRVRVIDK